MFRRYALKTPARTTWYKRHFHKDIKSGEENKRDEHMVNLEREKLSFSWNQREAITLECMTCKVTLLKKKYFGTAACGSTDKSVGYTYKCIRLIYAEDVRRYAFLLIKSYSLQDYLQFEFWQMNRSSICSSYELKIASTYEMHISGCVLGSNRGMPYLLFNGFFYSCLGHFVAFLLHWYIKMLLWIFQDRFGGLALCSYLVD